MAAEQNERYIDPEGQWCVLDGKPAWARANGLWLCFGCGLQYMDDIRGRRQRIESALNVHRTRIETHR